jgi:hypothetical protein
MLDLISENVAEGVSDLRATSDVECGEQQAGVEGLCEAAEGDDFIEQPLP